ncbi:hypothetical protein F2Q68_00043317 [Brassica cretica]|uniref:Uncharacterized protein n=1 Tax=Brassica cretica TaxID=69181 RepID=A0A8S9LUG7_BRACR|nr:hypothetical protein F2Q68_00043317 [Brassica cretica]
MKVNLLCETDDLEVKSDIIENFSEARNLYAVLVLVHIGGISDFNLSNGVKNLVVFSLHCVSESNDS